jgi:hypothetical protein
MNRELWHGAAVPSYARTLVLGPNWLHIVLAHVAPAKAEFDKANRGIKFQLAAQLSKVRHKTLKPNSGISE